MRPVLVTIAIVAVSFAVIAVVAGAAASLAAVAILGCAGTGTALYRRFAPRNLPEPEEVYSSSDRSHS
jgi:hypothetical protein